MDVLPPELCQKVFEDWVERPYLPLQCMLEYEVYRVSLFNLTYDRGVPGTLEQVRDWLNESNTFFRFKKEVSDTIGIHELNINVEALTEEDWMTHVPTNDVIVTEKFHWLKGGCIELRHDWRI